MKNIVLIQHTQAEHHLTKMVGGNTDWSLTELGKRQADKIGEKLKSVLDLKKEYIIYSSDLIRTKQTTEMVNRHLNCEVIYREELREMNAGSAKGKSNEWYNNNCLPRKNSSVINYRSFPDAETYEDLYNRLIPFVNEILNSDRDNIIIVGHGGSLQMFIMHWLNIPLELMEKLSVEGNAGGVSFLAEDKARLPFGGLPFSDNQVNSNQSSKKIRILKVWNNLSYIGT